MKICPKCYAKYDDSEVGQDQCFCIECYGEACDVKVVELNAFLATARIDDLKTKRATVERLNCADSSKRIMLRRIDKLIEVLNKS